MDKNKDVSQPLSHSIQINERKSIQLSGVKKIENFNKDEFFLQSIMGYILIKGEELELLKLDTFQGNISIKGKIDSFIYLDEKSSKQKKESILSKLFK